MRFDWYSATIRDDPTTVVDSLAAAYSAQVTTSHGMNGYEMCHELRTAEGVSARVLSGGRNGYPHALASGEATDVFVPAVRELWPDRHTVTRLDAAEDFDEAGAWDKLLQQCTGIADELRLKVDQQGDWHRGEDGRTFYVGSRKSAVFTRLYEKGKQLRGLVVDPEKVAAISTDWVRLEVQVRPTKEAKWTAARLTPAEVWGCASWTKELVSRCFELDVERVDMSPWREASDARAWHFLLKQYGGVLTRRAHQLGSWERLGELLKNSLEPEVGQ